MAGAEVVGVDVFVPRGGGYQYGIVGKTRRCVFMMGAPDIRVCW